jgi:hypothetical protein
MMDIINSRQENTANAPHPNLSGGTLTATDVVCGACACSAQCTCSRNENLTEDLCAADSIYIEDVLCCCAPPISTMTKKERDTFLDHMMMEKSWM